VEPRRRPPVWHYVLAVGLGLWTIAVTVVAQVALYLVDTLDVVTYGRPVADSTQVVVGLIAAALVFAPAAGLGALPLAGDVRAVVRAWAWAGAASALLAAARLAPAPRHEAYLFGLTCAALLASILQLWWATRRDKAAKNLAPQLQDRVEGNAGAGSAGLAGAVAGGLLLLVPWVWLGALGGPLETLLAATTAAALGWLAARITAPILQLCTASRPTSPDNVPATSARSADVGAGRLVVVGLAAGVALTPLAGATGETGVALAELGVLPVLGFALAFLCRVAGRVAGRIPRRIPRHIPLRGTAVLVALAAAGPLAFVDPEETSLVLGTNDVAFWALVGAASAFLVALLLPIGYALAGRRHQSLRRPVAAGLVAVLALGVVAVHIGLGQPGLHGDRLFVVLRQQADLTGLEAIPDRDERLRQTYRRLVAHADRTQASLRKDLRRYHVGFRPYYLVDAIEVDGGPAVRAWLSRRSDVDSVVPDPVLRPLPAEPGPPTSRTERPAGPLWNIEMIKADRVWEAANARGAGIVIGTSDSGVDGTHPALESAFRGGDDSWYDPWNGTDRPTDRNGHGTHTLGTALGRDGIGVAPEASWIGCVNLDRNLGNPAHYLDCLQFMLAPFPRAGDPFRAGRPERAAHVLTNSWGCPVVEGCTRPDLLRPAVNALTAAGIFVVAAAGNTGDAGCGSITDEPATDPEAMTVGAVTRTGAVASFSSRGPVPGNPGAVKPDVLAPGTGIVSAAPGGGYRAESGTSMATPHVAGVVALMWSANPRLIGDIDRTADILRSTARVGGLTSSENERTCGDPRNLRGAGLVDALAAVTAARAIGS